MIDDKTFKNLTAGDLLLYNGSKDLIDFLILSIYEMMIDAASMSYACCDLLYLKDRSVIKNGYVYQTDIDKVISINAN